MSQQQDLTLAREGSDVGNAADDAVPGERRKERVDVDRLSPHGRVIEREGLITAVRRKAPYFAKRLRSLDALPIVGEVWAVGLMGAVELVRDKPTREPFPAELKVAARVRAAALRRGVILRAGQDLIAVCPPFVITKEQIDVVVRALGEAIADVAAQV